MKKYKFIAFFLPVLFLIYSANLFSLSLKEAMDMAVKNSPKIKNSYYEKEAARYNKNSLNAFRFGEINIHGSAMHYNMDRVIVPMVPPIMPPFPPSDNNLSDAGVDYTLPLFTGFKVETRISINKLLYKISELKYSLTKKEILLNVYSIYLKGLSLKAQIKTAEKQLDALNELYSKIDIGVKVGKFAEIDLKKVDYKRELVRAKLKSLNNALNTLKHSLNQLTGYDNDSWDFEDIAEVELSSNVIHSKLSELNTQEIITKREEFSMCLRKKDIASKKYNQALFSYFPNIYATYRFDRIWADGVSRPLYNYGVVLKMPVFDFGKRIFEIKSAKRNKLAVENECNSVLFGLKKQIAEASNNLKSQYEFYVANTKALSYAEEAERVEELKYEEGVSSVYDLLRAISEYYNAMAMKKSSFYNVLTSMKYVDFVAGKEISLKGEGYEK